MEFKFRHSATLFTCEQDKIDYIRDHLKLTVFEVVKAQTTPNNDDPYFTASEVVRELDSMFGEYDKIGKADAKLHDPKFGMGKTNPNKTFDEFLVRYTSAIAPLGFNDVHKISNLRRTINDRLRWNLTDGTTYSSFGQYVNRCRQCDLDLRQSDSYKDRSDRPSNKRTITTETKKTYSSTGGNPEKTNYPPNVVAKLIKEGRCFKCLKTGHRTQNENAPCKNESKLTDEQVTLELKIIGAEKTETTPSEFFVTKS